MLDSQLDQHVIETVRHFLATSYTTNTSSFPFEPDPRRRLGLESRVFTFNLQDLLTFCNDHEVISHIINNAADSIKTIDECLVALAKEIRNNELYDDPNLVGPEILKNLICKPNGVSRNAHSTHEMHLKLPTGHSFSPVRKLRASDVGRLVKVRGIVTRLSEVMPLIEVAGYTCETCGFNLHADVAKRNYYRPSRICDSEACGASCSPGRLHASMRTCKFTKFQPLQLQELPTEVPVGQTPRSICVRLRGELTRSCSPGTRIGSFTHFVTWVGQGEIVVVTGIFLPEVDGLPGVQDELVRATCLQATHVDNEMHQIETECNSTEVNASIDQVANSNDAYSSLARSIAPEIFGLEDIKKSLLLQLVGGVSREVAGLHIRGDVHVCLTGDPGLAKSQLLKYMATCSPRGIYTTGKGSSVTGLTAAISRDAASSDASIDSGALVLADCGVCCIDEFDKMDEQDRSGIHEVMEQQSVSIAKAGITTKLNARCAILAAANPRYGRYNPVLSVLQNINLPISLLSRFDLLFLMVDRPDVIADTALARHITHVHRYLKGPVLDFEPFEASFLRQYVSQARLFEPFIPNVIAHGIVDNFVEQRQQAHLACENSLTARQLLSILRLAQALARLRFDDVVTQSDIDEASRLARVAKASFDLGEGPKSPASTSTSRAYNVLRKYASMHGTQVIDYQEMHDMLAKQGIREETLLSLLQDFNDLSVIHYDAEKNLIRFT